MIPIQKSGNNHSGATNKSILLQAGDIESN